MSGRATGLSALTAVPDKLTWPLRRRYLDPVEELAARQRVEPLTRLTRVLGLNVWLVTGYEPARAVLSDASNFSNDIRPLTGSQNSTEAGTIGGLGFTDAPEHTRLRGYLTPEFTRRRLERLQPVIDHVVEDQLDLLGQDDEQPVDFVSGFAFPVPYRIICALLGLTEDDLGGHEDQAGGRFDVRGGGPTTFGAMSQAREALLHAVRRQRLDPGDGLLGTLIRDHGDDLSDLDLVGLADGLFTGGYETSASMLALGALTLLRDENAFAMIAEGDSDVDAVVEELLRYLSVVQISFPRFARADLTMFGARIKAGDAVVCSLSGANRDSVFGVKPDRFDPHRSGASHLAFGHGFHRCIGAELARMELRTALRALARRFPNLTLAVDPTSLKFRELSIVYGLDSLPVRLNGPLTVGARPAGAPVESA